MKRTVATCAVALGFAIAAEIGCAEGTGVSEEGASAAATGTSTGGAGAGGPGDPSTNASGPSSTGAGLDGPGSTGTGGSGGGGPVPQSCVDGEVAVGLGPSGDLVCAPIDEAAEAAVNGACTVYFGWRDECGGCTSPPAKWGKVSATACSNGTGIDDTCTTPSLGGQTIQMFGLNTDGDVNDDDKLYLGLSCGSGSAAEKPAPCGPGELVSAISNGVATCTSASAAILAYVHQSCFLHIGWSDECGGCSTPPAKWGRVSHDACEIGTGAGNTCTTAVLGSETVQLFGLSTGGDVDENDKFYFGLRCLDAVPEASMSSGACPPGQFVVGVIGDGSVACESIAPLASEWIRDHCFVYAGWRDSCDGCTSPPTKWGRARDGFCENGAGAEGTCAKATLGAVDVHLYGLGTDGDVNGDDKLYLGFTCL